MCTAASRRATTQTDAGNKVPARHGGHHGQVGVVGEKGGIAGLDTPLSLLHNVVVSIVGEVVLRVEPGSWRSSCWMGSWS